MKYHGRNPTGRLAPAVMFTLLALPASLAANPAPQEPRAAARPPLGPESTAVGTTSLIGESPVAGIPMELAVLVQEALTNNPRLESVRERWNQAEAVPAGARDLPDPSLRFGVYNVPLDSLNFSRGEFRVQYRQDLPARGTRERRSAVAGLEADRRRFDFEAARVELAAAVARAYYELYFAERAREIHHQHLELVRELSTAAEELYATAQVPQENVLRSLVELSELFGQLADVDSRIGIATASLNRLLHRPPTSAVGSPLPPPIVQRRLDMLGLIERGANHHPGVAEATSAIERDQAAVELERHEAKADWGITAEWWTGSTPVGRTYRYAFLVTTTLPFVHDAKYVSATEQALASQRFSEAARLDVVNRVAEGVSSALIRMQAQARIIELHRTSVIPQSEQSLEAARSAYGTGTADFVSVVDNERTLLLNRLALARAEADYGIAIADLGAALGVIDPVAALTEDAAATDRAAEGAAR